MKIKKSFFLAILAFTVLGLYWQTLNYPLIWDDRTLFENNPLFDENKSLISALKASYFRQQIGLGSIDFYYRPILMASFWLEDRLWGIHPFSLRLINIILFITGIAIWYLFFKARYDFSSFPEIASILFALFPLHVDNVVWIVGRSDLLLIIFSGLCFILLDSHVKQKNRYSLFIASLAFAFGVFAKESFLFFIPILIIAEYVFHKKINIFFHSANVVIAASYFLIKGPILHIRNISMLWPKGISSFLASLIGPIGYYTKVIIFPLGGRRFISSLDLGQPIYILWGTLGLLALLMVIFLSKKKLIVLIPASFIFFFILGHSALIFSRLFPYKAYARYMIIPALGFIWLLSQQICKLKEKSRSIIAFIFLIIFIPRIVFLTREYRHEIFFWQKAVSLAPTDIYARYELASAFFRYKNYIDAEVVLNQSLFMKMPQETALLVSLQYADIELVKANYDYVFRWLDSIDSLYKQTGIELGPYMQVILRGKRALAELALGRWEEAEMLLLENVRSCPDMKENYEVLYSLYLGREQWDKALSLEKIMMAKFPKGFEGLDTRKIKEQFLSLNSKQKLAFYELHRNYPKAIELLENEQNIASQEKEELIFQLARLCLKNGQAEKAMQIISGYLEKVPPQTELLNRIAFFFINEFNRIKEGVSYLQKSLELDNTQAEIKYMIVRLTQNYINRLKPVWPEEKLD